MAIKKRIKFNIYPGNKTKASATLHQGNNWDDANPVKCIEFYLSSIAKFYTSLALKSIRRHQNTSHFRDDRLNLLN